MAITGLAPYAAPGKAQAFQPKTPASYPPIGLLVEEFDIYIEGYAGSIINILRAGTNELLPVYTDPGLTQQTTNPQVLISKTDASGRSFGKFRESIYVPEAYQIEIDTTEQGGVHFLPITDLGGKDASDAVVKAKNGTTFRSLKDRAAEVVNALDYGALGESTTTNTNTLIAAIAAASLKGGVPVVLPAMVIPFTQINLPENIMLDGQGMDATVLVSQVAGNCITFTGDSAGLSNLQVDGVNLNTGSVGLYSTARQFIRLENLLVRRFDTGVLHLGGQDHVYRNVFVKNCNRCVRLLGDENTSGGATGDEFSGMDWFQGVIAESTIVGLEFTVVDLPVRHNAFHQVDFLDNIGADGAVFLYGAAWTTFRQCYWEQGGSEYKNIVVRDNDDVTLVDREVVGLHIQGGQIQDGKLSFDGLCQDIILDQVQIEGATFEMNVPRNQVLLRDCVESETAVTGDSTKLSRFRTIESGSVAGQTVNGSAIVAWKTKLEPNEVIQVVARATAEQVNGAGFADFILACGARRAPSTLPYDSQTANFTVGNVITGLTSGASAIIVADSDSGTTGTLSLGDISGEFVDNELITENTGTGSARVNGSLTGSTVALVGTATSIRAAGSATGSPPAGWAVGFAASNQEFQVTLTGAAATTIFWNLKIENMAL